MLGCTYHTGPDEVIPQRPCNRNIRINGQVENFCGDFNPGHASEFTEDVNDSLTIIHDQDFQYNFSSSTNYQAFLIAFSAYKSDSLDYQSEINFFDNLVDLMQPESLHDLDLSKNGGFGIEVWAKDGEYYSTEFNLAIQPGQVEIRLLDLNLFGRLTGQIISYMELTLQTTQPVRLWNEAKNDSLEVEFNFYKMPVSFF